MQGRTFLFNTHASKNIDAPWLVSSIELCFFDYQFSYVACIIKLIFIFLRKKTNSSEEKGKDWQIYVCCAVTGSS